MTCLVSKSVAGNCECGNAFAPAHIITDGDKVRLACSECCMICNHRFVEWAKDSKKYGGDEPAGARDAEQVGLFA